MTPTPQEPEQPLPDWDFEDMSPKHKPYNLARCHAVRWQRTLRFGNLKIIMRKQGDCVLEDKHPGPHVSGWGGRIWHFPHRWWAA